MLSLENIDGARSDQHDRQYRGRGLDHEEDLRPLAQWHRIGWAEGCGIGE